MRVTSILTSLNFLGWNWLSGSGEEDENVKRYRLISLTYDNRWQVIRKALSSFQLRCPDKKHRNMCVFDKFIYIYRFIMSSSSLLPPLLKKISISVLGKSNIIVPLVWNIFWGTQLFFLFHCESKVHDIEITICLLSVTEPVIKRCGPMESERYINSHNFVIFAKYLRWKITFSWKTGFCVIMKIFRDSLLWKFEVSFTFQKIVASDCVY